MFVRQLIGREAGAIVELPYHAATACLAGGTAAEVTDEEIAAAGLTLPPAAPVNEPEQLPRGYRAEPDIEGYGYNVIDPGGVTLNQRPLPNLAAARSLAHEHADPRPKLAEEAGNDEDDEPVDLAVLTRAQLDALAAERGIDVHDAKNKADVIAAIELAEEAGNRD